MKISEILATPPIKTEHADQIRYLDWGDLFRFDITISRRSYGFYPLEETLNVISAMDIKQLTYWADHSQGQELNCIYIDGTPVVLYETTDSWDVEGQTWVLDGDKYLALYEMIRGHEELTLYNLDDEIDSSYVGIETPKDAYFS